MKAYSARAEEKKNQLGNGEMEQEIFKVSDGPETMLTPPPEGVSDSKSVTPPAINTNAESVPGSKPSFAPTFNSHMFQHILMLISTLFLIV